MPSTCFTKLWSFGQPFHLPFQRVSIVSWFRSICDIKWHNRQLCLLFSSCRTSVVVTILCWPLAMYYSVCTWLFWIQLLQYVWELSIKLSSTQVVYLISICHVYYWVRCVVYSIANRCWIHILAAFLQLDTNHLPCNLSNSHS